MRRIPGPHHEHLFGVDASRAIEQTALGALPPHSLMTRAGIAVAHLARAIAPHAQRIWVACGPGNNGGDGLVAATELQRASLSTGNGVHVTVTLCADPGRLPADAALALHAALAAGVSIQDDGPASWDLAIDALLGIGRLRPPEGRLAAQLMQLHNSTAPVLCVDLPSGLDADSGRHWYGQLKQPLVGERHTLALLTLKPGLFTADGRDQAGTVWFDDLGVHPGNTPHQAMLWCGTCSLPAPPHAAHKGSRGDVLVLGGQAIDVSGTGMTGAAVLAARAALRSGAGRVYLCLLGATPDAAPIGWDPASPELMLRHWAAVRSAALLDTATVVCGCGGGTVVTTVLTEVLERAPTLVLDADGLNAAAADADLQNTLIRRHAKGLHTVLTPHPLEAARLLGERTGDVMGDRLGAAKRLSERFGAVCVLKGSGTIICSPETIPIINASGNSALATAGTGDVLAGMIGAALAAAGESAPIQEVVAQTVCRHGGLADQWVASATDGTGALTAGMLVSPMAPGRISPGG